jgi:hypothetical protein
MNPVDQAVKSDFKTTGVDHTEIRVKGRPINVPSVQIDGRTVISGGKLLMTAVVHDEDLVEGETVVNPESFVSRLKQSGLKADIFTFAQKLPDTAPKYQYEIEWDNFAVIPITTYSAWFKDRIESSVQRAIRKAAKSGVLIRRAELDDEFLNGIVKINNESPIRQGRTFWHFQKSFDAVKHEHLTYADRNVFLGAYIQDELIGYIRMVYTDKVASLLQLLTMVKHYDKRPANALIAKAVEVCEHDGMSYLMYCNYVYKDPNSSLTEFKRRSGFEQVLLPRYYIPLTLKGKIAVRLGLHRGLAKQIPASLVRLLLKIRNYWYGRRLKALKGAL